MVQGQAFKGRQFAAEVILWAVRWYLMFPVSYRDLELMLQDRGVVIDHTTIFRWVQAYAAELEKRIRPHLRPTNGSWRVDETYIRVKGIHPVTTARTISPTVVMAHRGCRTGSVSMVFNASISDRPR